MCIHRLVCVDAPRITQNLLKRDQSVNFHLCLSLVGTAAVEATSAASVGILKEHNKVAERMKVMEGTGEWGERLMRVNEHV